MSTALFEDIIFGPIKSRRLGLSLGVNLLPERAKICNFDCIYCECGSNSERRGELSQRRFADSGRVRQALRERLEAMVADGTPPDVITFAGNGEPTLHPDFEQIIDFTIAIRDELSPLSKISVLSNATRLANESVVRALKRIDNNILKIDSAIESTAGRINRPVAGYSVTEVIEQVSQFEAGEAIIQTMFLRGDDGLDNTTDEELSAWLRALEAIRPASVMIYSIDRDTPCSGLIKVEKVELERIAERVKALGINCTVA